MSAPREFDHLIVMRKTDLLRRRSIHRSVPLRPVTDPSYQVKRIQRMTSPQVTFLSPRSESSENDTCHPNDKVLALRILSLAHICKADLCVASLHETLLVHPVFHACNFNDTSSARIMPVATSIHIQGSCRHIISFNFHLY